VRRGEKGNRGYIGLPGAGLPGKRGKGGVIKSWFK